MNLSTNQILQQQQLETDEVELRQVAAVIWRHRLLVGGVTASAALLGGIYAFAVDPIWAGHFQIVLAEKNSPISGGQALLEQNAGISDLIDMSSGSKNNLKTEVKILESPSVLKPVFDYVKASRQADGEDVSNLSYSDWIRDNLDIKLAKGTSVLNLSYKDTDKSIIIPVLEQISQQYQSYSGKDRQRGLSQALEYLDQQIKVYKEKSVISLRNAQEFAIDQDLTALQNSDPTPGNDDGDAEILNALNIEVIRVEAANEIRNINEQLTQLNTLGDNLESLMYLGQTIPELASQGLPQTLDKIDTELALLRATYTDKENKIRRLKERRVILIETLRRQTYGYLWAKRTAAQARMAAAERPKGVLIKYRELLREVRRDEGTLSQLEVERQALALEKAREEDPWELISIPSMLDKPVAPIKKRIVALGGLFGLVLGCVAALIQDRRSGYVFNIDQFKSLLPCPLLEQLPSDDPKHFVDSAQLLAEGPLANAESVGLLMIGEIQEEQIKQFSVALQNALGERPLVVSRDLLETRKTSIQLLITSPGTAERRNLQKLREQLALQGTPLAGWLFIDPKIKSLGMEA